MAIFINNSGGSSDSIDSLTTINGEFNTYPSCYEDIDPLCYVDIYQRKLYQSTNKYGTNYTFPLDGTTYITITTLYQDNFKYRLFTVNSDGSRNYLNSSTSIGSGTSTTGVSRYVSSDIRIIRYKNTNVYFFIAGFYYYTSSSQQYNVFNYMKFTFNTGDSYITYVNQYSVYNEDGSSADYNISYTYPTGSNTRFADYYCLDKDTVFAIYYYHTNTGSGSSANRRTYRLITVCLKDDGSIYKGYKALSQLTPVDKYQELLSLYQEDDTSFICVYSAGANYLIYVCRISITMSSNAISNVTSTSLSSSYLSGGTSATVRGNGISLDFNDGYIYFFCFPSISRCLVVRLNKSTYVLESVYSQTISTPDLTIPDIIFTSLTSSSVYAWTTCKQIIDMGNNRYMMLFSYVTSGTYYPSILGLTFKYNNGLTDFSDYNVIYRKQSSSTNGYYSAKCIDDSHVYVLTNYASGEGFDTIKIGFDDWVESVIVATTSTDKLLLTKATNDEKGKVISYAQV